MPNFSTELQNYTTSISTNTWLNELDVPKTAHDSLGRSSFARALSDAIAQLPNDRSVVTAVYGQWGSGKTWLLEKIVDFLGNDHSSTIDVCRFCPWDLKSHEQILMEFFSLVRSKIPQSAETQGLHRLWIKLEQIVLIGSLGVSGVSSALQLGQDGAVAQSAAALTSIAALLATAAKSHQTQDIDKTGQQTLTEVKDALVTELSEKLRRPILIVIDDLDRLTNGEIQLMIRLLNTTANLPKLHYLIFGDRLQIASALDPICGNKGDQYLEKLVQNSFQVPEPGENQVRLRLWEGIVKLAKETHIEASSYASRFTKFWNAFLKFRIGNYRDCHRLLRTLAFHANSLTKEGTLEVDLMDLLGIDFIRVFDPSLYHHLTSEIPTKFWCSTQLYLNTKGPDSKKLLDLVKASRLGDQIACGVILSLFPHLTEHLKNYLEANQLEQLRYGHSREKPSPLGIGNIERTEIYFRLDLTAGDLPEARVKEFSYALNDPIRMYKLLVEFNMRNWILQLFGRLQSDPKFIKDGASSANILIAISSISDDLESNELHGSAQLSDFLIQRMNEHGMKEKIMPAILESGSLSLALLIIEQMRHASSCSFYPGAKAPMGLIQKDPEEIDMLVAELLPEVVKRFASNHFMKQDFDSWRAYRMAHALGPMRTEQVLRHPVSGKIQGKVWKLVEAIALSTMPSIGLDSWNEANEENSAGSCLLGELKQFASLQFWKTVISADHTEIEPPSDFAKLLIPHLVLAIQRDEIAQ